jgi:hypothetical protein
MAKTMSFSGAIRRGLFVASFFRASFAALRQLEPNIPINRERAVLLSCPISFGRADEGELCGSTDFGSGRAVH